MDDDDDLHIIEKVEARSSSKQPEEIVIDVNPEMVDLDLLEFRHDSFYIGNRKDEEGRSSPVRQTLFCLFCSERMETLATAMTHIASHFDYCPIKCTICSIRFKDMEYLSKHHISKHLGLSDHMEFQVLEDYVVEKWITDFVTFQVNERKYIESQVLDCSCKDYCPVCQRVHQEIERNGSPVNSSRRGHRQRTCDKHGGSFFIEHLKAHMKYLPYQCMHCLREGKPTAMITDQENSALAHMGMRHPYLHRSSYKITDFFPRTVVIPLLDTLIKTRSDSRQSYYAGLKMSTGSKIKTASQLLKEQLLMEKQLEEEQSSQLCDEEPISVEDIGVKKLVPILPKTVDSSIVHGTPVDPSVSCLTLQVNVPISKTVSQPTAPSTYRPAPLIPISNLLPNPVVSTVTASRPTSKVATSVVASNAVLSQNAVVPQPQADGIVLPKLTLANGQVVILTMPLGTTNSISGGQSILAATSSTSISTKHNPGRPIAPKPAVTDKLQKQDILGDKPTAEGRETRMKTHLETRNRLHQSRELLHRAIKRPQQCLRYKHSQQRPFSEFERRPVSNKRSNIKPFEGDFTKLRVVTEGNGRMVLKEIPQRKTIVTPHPPPKLQNDSPHFRIEGGRVINLEALTAQRKFLKQKELQKRILARKQRNRGERQSLLEGNTDRMVCEESNEKQEPAIKKPAVACLMPEKAAVTIDLSDDEAGSNNVNQEEDDPIISGVPLFEENPKFSEEVKLAPLLKKPELKTTEEVGGIVAAIPEHEMKVLQQKEADDVYTEVKDNTEDEDFREYVEQELIRQQQKEITKRMRIQQSKRIQMLRNNQELRLMNNATTAAGNTPKPNEPEEIVLGDRTFWRCSQCSNIFSSQKSLKLHSTQVHSKIRILKINSKVIQNDN